RISLRASQSLLVWRDRRWIAHQAVSENRFGLTARIDPARDQAVAISPQVDVSDVRTVRSPYWIGFVASFEGKAGSNFPLQVEDVDVVIRFRHSKRELLPVGRESQLIHVGGVRISNQRFGFSLAAE